MSHSSRLPELLAQVYRILLRAYPASFRREYGEEMVDTFRSLVQEAWQNRGMIGMASLCLHMVPDFLLSGTAQHFHETQRRIAMVKRLFDPAYSVVVLAAVLLVAALVTPADPLSMLLVGLPVYFVYLIAARWFRPNRGADTDTTDPSPREERIV